MGIKTILRGYTDLAGREFLQERGLLVGLAEHKVRCNGHLGAGELGGDQRLVSTEVFRVGVQCLQ